MNLNGAVSFAGYLVAVALFFSTGVGNAFPACDGPTHLVKVSVQEISPRTYIYTVSNLYTVPIRYFELGVSDSQEMEIRDDNIPSEINAPQGWSGNYNFFDESEYMHISWSVKDSQQAILPNAVLGGFKVVIPPLLQTKEPLYGASGKLSKPLDMKSAPYHIMFKDGKCVWGRAVTDSQ